MLTALLLACALLPIDPARNDPPACQCKPCCDCGEKPKFNFGVDMDKIGKGDRVADNVMQLRGEFANLNRLMTKVYDDAEVRYFTLIAIIAGQTILHIVVLVSTRNGP